ncbi:MAG: polyprenyl diphosphate synthase [Candidatus Muiribacteriota bacterium]
MPEHIAVIMDGNGRWARKRKMPRIIGHRNGVKNVRNLCDWCINYKIPYVSVYAFSTENWKRPDEEISGLIHLFRDFIIKDALKLLKKNIRLVVSGDFSVFPTDLEKGIKNLIQKSKQNDSLTLNVMLNYGGHSEIVRACKEILKNNISPELITPELFSQYLYNSFMPPPDILIRTGGDKRISNFMLWQLAYTELFFIKKMWPEFNREDFIFILKEFSNRERRFGANV